MESKEHTTHTTSEPTSGNAYLDKFLDELPVDAKAALLALLERHGQDPAIDGARARLEHQMARFESPEVLDEHCRLVDDSSLEERVGFWQAYRAGWAAVQSRS